MKISEVIDRNRLKDYFVIRDNDDYVLGDIFEVVDILNNYRYVVNNNGDIVLEGNNVTIDRNNSLITRVYEKDKNQVFDKDGNVLFRGNKIKIIDNYIGISNSCNRYKLVGLGENVICGHHRYNSVFLLNGYYGVVRNNKYGVVDKNGRVVIKIKYDNIISTNSNIFIYKKNGKYGIVNNTGYEITKDRFDIINEVDKNLFVVNVNGLFGLIDNLGRYLIDSIYFHVNVFDNCIMALRDDGYYDIYDRKCHFMYSLECDGIEEVDNVKRVYKNDEFRYLDRENKDIFDKGFNYGTNVNNGTIVVKEKEDSGYYLVDLNRKRLSCDYDWIQYLDYGYYVTRKNNYAGLIDRFGNVAVDNLYDGIASYLNGIVLKKDKKYVFCSYDKKIVSDSYDLICGFYSGLSVVKRNGKYGVINSLGDEIVDTVYDRVLILKNGDIYVDGFIIKNNVKVKKRV